MNEIASRTEQLTDDLTVTVRRYRVDAAYAPLTDEIGRTVHGYAVIEEYPDFVRGQTYKQVRHGYTRTFGAGSCFVSSLSTRNGATFGAIPRRTAYLDLAAATAGATKSMVDQGKRYARKYGNK